MGKSTGPIGPTNLTHHNSYTYPLALKATFDVRMCKSHMCTECTLEWCMTSCQKLQEEHAGCRCEAWPDARVSYSGGMKNAGKYGDVGDYSK